MPRTPKPTLVTRRDLAERLGVHVCTVQKWERAGLPLAKRGGRGMPSLYVEADVRAWRERRDAHATAGQDVDLVRERANKEKWQGAVAEQTFRMRQRDLIPAAEVERLWSGQLAAIRSALLAGPAALADQLQRIAVTDGAAAVEEALDAWVRAVLTELSRDDAPVPDLGDLESNDAPA